MLNVQSTPHSQTHFPKLWQFQTNYRASNLKGLFKNTKAKDILNLKKNNKKNPNLYTKI